MKYPRRVLGSSDFLHHAHAIQSSQQHDVALPLTPLEDLGRIEMSDAVFVRTARESVRQFGRPPGAHPPREQASERRR